MLNRESTHGIEHGNSRGENTKHKPNHPGIQRQDLRRSSKLSQPPTQPATEQPCHSRVDELAVRLCRGGRGFICKWGVTEDTVLNQLAGGAERAVGHGGQQGRVYLHPLVKGVDFDSGHLFRYVKLHGKGDITEGVQGAQMDGLPLLCQDFNVRQHLGRTRGEVCGPEGERIGVDGVQEAQLQDAAVRLGAWHRHVHVVQVELRTPGLQAGLTGLIHIWGPWTGGTRKRLMRTQGIADLPGHPEGQSSLQYPIAAYASLCYSCTPMRFCSRCRQAPELVASLPCHPRKQ